MGVKWFAFLNEALDLIGMWFSEDQRANFIRTLVSREIGLRFHILITALHLVVNTIERICVSS